MEKSYSESYAAAGVDITAGYRSVELNENADLQQEWHETVDRLEGTKLTVTVTFADGSTQTRTMTLHTGKLGIEFNDDTNGPQLNGEVLTDAQAEEQGYLYGVYGELD